MNYRLFGKSGLRVSEIALGTMTLGTEWGTGADKSESKKIFETYAKAGGNFIDTANRYTEGTSEKFLGEFIKSDRDHFVLATKYTLHDRLGDPNFAGNHRKNMMRSVEESLSRMKTDFIDVLWVHAWDFITPVEEVMRGLDDLVRAGKVHYIGISDTPAWVASRANMLAELRGWTQFVGLQIEYNLIQRDGERDLIPMAKELGMAVTPWAPIAGGALSGKYLKGQKGRVPADSVRLNKRSTKIVEVVVDVAKKLDCSPVHVALKWCMQKDFVSIPIVGARKASQMKESLGCLDVVIPANLMKRLDEVGKPDLGFPHDFLARESVRDIVYSKVQDKILR